MPYSPLQLANAFIQTGELADALEALDTHLNAVPDDESALRLRAAVLARRGEDAEDSFERLHLLEKALADLDAAAAVTPDDLILKSVLLERLNRTEAALALLEATNYLQHQRLAERYLHLLRKRGDTRQAATVLEQLMQVHPHEWRWAQWAGDLARDGGDDFAAVGYYTSALVTIVGRYDFNLDSAAKVLENTPNDAIALTIAAVYARLKLARAEVFHKMGRLDLAALDYKAAAKLIPNDPMIGFNLGLIAAAQDDMDSALVYCRAVIGRASPALHKYMQAALLEKPIFAPLMAHLGQDFKIDPF